MINKKILKFLILLLIFSTFNIAKAECVLNFDNLTINSQSVNDKANIVKLQSILYINDLYDGPITGYYGSLTEKAINFLKNSRGLKADGVVDNKTIDILCNNYTTCPFQSSLENGDDNPKKEIKFIQYFLRLLPNVYPEKLVTGYFGSKTENAVKRFQKALSINVTGKIDNNTRNKFCEFFNNFDNDSIVGQSSSGTTSIFQTLCLAFPKEVKTGQNVTFISQILGGNSPYTYIWNNQAKYNEKTLKASFSKAGVYTANLKVTDNKGNTSMSNCKVTVKGDTLAQNDVSLDNLQFETNGLENTNDNTNTPSNSSTTIKQSTMAFDAKTFYASIEKYVSNPVKLDYEILPIETVKGDPIKINIINIPVDIKEKLFDQWKARSSKRLKTYWTGDDIINQSLDRVVLNDEWYTKISDSKVSVALKRWSIFNDKTYAPKTKGWFELPSNKMFSGGSSLVYSNYYSKGYNPKDDWSIYQKGLYFDYAEAYYNNSNKIKKEIANYFVFNYSGNYNIRFNIYFTSTNNNQEYLIAYIDIPIKVLEKANNTNYVKTYITPGASKNPPTCASGYTNTVPEWTEYPYRDLDGKFVGYNWQHLFVDDFDNGGGLWNYLNLTNIFAPLGSKNNLITGQEGLFKDWERLFNIGVLGSTLYRAFQSDPEDLFYVNQKQPQYQDKYMCATWYNFQVNALEGFGINGAGFRKSNVYLDNPDKISGAQNCRGICFQTTDLPDAKNPIVNKRINNLYPDLIIKDYQMDNINKEAGTFNIKYLVKNIGGADFRTQDYANNNVVISCKKGSSAGVDLDIYHVQTKQNKKVDFGAIINRDIKAGEEVWTTLKTTRDYCPSGETLVGCVIDPADAVDETEEKNNRFEGVKINCEASVVSTPTPTTVTSKQTSQGIMYNLLTWPNQINFCSTDSDCNIKRNTVYCTHKWDNAPVTAMPNNYYFDKDCKCVGKRCQAVDKNN